MLERCLIKKGKLIIKHLMVDWHLFPMTTVGVPLISSAWKLLRNVQEVTTLRWNINGMTHESIYQVMTCEPHFN